ncbi:MAG: PfkB family carbohydrate kinase [Nocardioides sp.]
MSVALVIGEALVDVVKQPDGSSVEYAGGSAANVAVALSRLERTVRFATAFADDGYGEVVRNHLSSAGVELASAPEAVEHTSSAIATIAEDGSASYVFDIEWKLNPLSLGDAVPVVVHTSSLAAVLSPGAADVFAAVAGFRESAVISYDINARPSITGVDPEVVDAVERLVGLADVVKASDEDLSALYPAMSNAEAAEALLRLGRGPVVVVVTRGGEGALWVTANGRGEIASKSVEVADTIGAGDTFGAAFLDELWTRGLVGPTGREGLMNLTPQDWSAICDYAAAAASITVSRPGADPPYKRELAAPPGRPAAPTTR